MQRGQTIRTPKAIGMEFEEFGDQGKFRAAWNAVRIARPVSFTLFTFGATDLEYYLVCEGGDEDTTVTVRRGSVEVTRPLILRPDKLGPEFVDFFDSSDEESAASFLLARSAAFQNLRFENHFGPSETAGRSLSEVVERLDRRLDDEREDRVAILTAPDDLAGMAVFRYVVDRITESAPSNITELREKGFLP